MNHWLRRVVFASALAVTGLAAAVAATAVSEQDATPASPIPHSERFNTIYVFDQAHGSAPLSEVVRFRRGLREFYEGVTHDGGAYGTGALYQVSEKGRVTLLHSFIQNGQDGFWPEARLTRASDGSLWGTTFGGGTHYAGTIFRVSSDGVYGVVHSFGDVDADGSFSGAPLTEAPDGSLFGTTESGGQYGQGMIFRITTAGAYQVVYALRGQDGDIPQHGLTLASDGNFYGGTNVGGEYGNGTLFRVDPAGHFTRLLSLRNETTGVYPSRLLQGSDGLLYGALASAGPQNGGALFRMTLEGKFTLLHAFGNNSSDGLWPTGLMQARDGNFYGTTAGTPGNPVATLFSLHADGTLKILHRFRPASSEHPLDGASPLSPPIEAQRGLLVGTTSSGGGYPGYGTVYSYTLP